MKKIVPFIIIIFISILLFVLFNNKKQTYPIESIMSSYSNYKFHDINVTKKFKIEEYEALYNNTNKTLTLNYKDKLLVFKIVENRLHYINDDIDYKLDNLGEVDRIMQYKPNNCEENVRIVVLTKEGKIKYFDLAALFDSKYDYTFNEIESNDFYTNIGYVENLNKPSMCTVNGIITTTYDDTVKIYDDNMKIFTQDYYTYLKNDKEVIYIYPDGTISSGDIKVNEAFVSDNIFYFVDNKSNLYKYTDKLVKVNNKKILKIGYRENSGESLMKESALIIFEDASAKTFKIDDNTNVLK